MTDREKLVELINHVCEGHAENLMQPYGVETVADHLIANGVTVNDDCKACAEATHECIVGLQEKIAEMRKKLEWISVEDRLPDGEVLAANFRPGTYGYKEYIIGYISPVKCFDPDWKKGKHVATNDFEILENVTHWLPLPEALKEE